MDRSGHEQREVESRRRRAFTLTELLVVVGLISVLLSLLLPVVAKARSAANQTVCASNLRQLGTAWTMYLAESRGRLPRYTFGPPETPDEAWRGYWIGITDSYKARGSVNLCPEASEAAGLSANRGFGNARYAWTGRFASAGSGVRFNATMYREGSYGVSRYMFAGAYISPERRAVYHVGHVREQSNAPLIMDCAYSDVSPNNGTEEFPVSSPPDLTGTKVSHTSPQHWRVLLARHGRGINVCMADGSARRVELDELYRLRWTGDWLKYRLELPVR